MTHNSDYRPLRVNGRAVEGPQLNAVGEQTGWSVIHRCACPGCNVQVKAGGKYPNVPIREIHADPSDPVVFARWGNPIGDV